MRSIMQISLKDLWGRRLSVDVEQKFSDVTAEINAVRAEEKQQDETQSSEDKQDG